MGNENALSVQAKLIDVCNQHGVLYETEGDAFGIIPRRFRLRLNPNIPKSASQEEAEIAIVEICKEHDLKYDVLFNSNGAKLLPTGIEIFIAKGSAIDTVEADMVRRMIKANQKFVVLMSPSIHSYIYSESNPKMICDKVTFTHDMPEIYPTESLRSEESCIEDNVKTTIIRRALRKAPLINRWLAKWAKTKIEAEIDIDDSLLRMAGIPGYGN